MTWESYITPCRFCGADIFFLETGKLDANGKKKYMPMDAEAIIIQKAGVLFCDGYGKLKTSSGGEKGNIPHFATCPEAGQFRK